MKIPTPWSAIRALDHEVHYLFMKAGVRKIPEKTRAYLSYGLTLFGGALSSVFVSTKFSPETITNGTLIIANMANIFPNVVHNRRVIRGSVSNQQDSVDIVARYTKSWNQIIRPLYVVAAGLFTAKLGYNLLESLGPEVLDGFNLYLDFGSAIGSAMVATSFYINDVDPKVLDKSSKLQDAYDTITGKELEPVPANNYQTLEDVL